MEQTDKLWYVNWPCGQIEMLDFGRTPLRPKILAAGFLVVGSLVVDSEYGLLYYTADNAIRRMEMDGRDNIILTTTVREIASLAIDNQSQKLYYSSIPGSRKAKCGQIRSVNFDGTHDVAVKASLNVPTRVLVDPNSPQIYYIDRRRNLDTLFRYDLTTKKETRIVSSKVRINDVCLIGGRFFFACRDGIKVIADRRLEMWMECDDPQSIIASNDNVIYIALRQNGNHLLAKVGGDQEFEWVHMLGSEFANGEPSNAASCIGLDPMAVRLFSATHVAIVSEDRKRVGIIPAAGGPPDWLLTRDHLENIRGLAFGAPTVVEDFDTLYAYICCGGSPTSPPANSINSVYVGGESSTPIATTELPDPTSLAIADEEGSIYYTTDTGIGVLGIDDGSQSILLNPGLGYSDLTACAWDPTEGLLWWSGRKQRSKGIFTLNAQGKLSRVLEKPVDHPQSPETICLDYVARSVYWSSHGGIYRTSYEGGAIAEVRAPRQPIMWLAVDGTHVYWSTDEGVYRMELSGKAEECLYLGRTGGFAIG